MNKNLERRCCLFVLDDCVRSKSYFHTVIAHVYWELKTFEVAKFIQNKHQKAAQPLEWSEASPIS